MMSNLFNRVVLHWKSTTVGILLAAVAVGKAIQSSQGHDKVTLVVAIGTALLGVLSKD